MQDHFLCKLQKKYCKIYKLAHTEEKLKEIDMTKGKKIIIGALAFFAIAGISGGSKPQDKATDKKPDIYAAPIVTVPDTKDSVQKAETKEVIDTEAVPYASSTVKDASLASGKTVTRSAGVNGVKTKVFSATFINGKELARQLKSESVTTDPVSEVIAVGTYVSAAPKAAYNPPSSSESSCDPNYSPCIRNTTGDALNCGDIRMRVNVKGIDHNSFDRDGDGVGCESY